MSDQIEQEVDRVLREALELFRTTHWTQHSYHRYDYVKGKDFYCSVGAIRTLSRRNLNSRDVSRAAVGRVARELKADRLLPGKALGLDDENLIVWWNDSPARRLQDVLDVFERASSMRLPWWRKTLNRVRRAFS